MGNNASSEENNNINDDEKLIIDKIKKINKWIDRIKAQAKKLQDNLQKNILDKPNPKAVENTGDNSNVNNEIKRLQDLIETKVKNIKQYNILVNTIVESANAQPYLVDGEGDIKIDTSSFSTPDNRRAMSIDSNTGSDSGPGVEESKNPEAERQAREAENVTKATNISIEQQLFPRNSFSGGYYYPSSYSKINRKSLKNRKKYKGKGKSKSNSRGGRSRGRGMSRGRSRGRGRQ